VPIRCRWKAPEHRNPPPERPADRREDGGQRDRPHQNELLLGRSKYVRDGETERDDGTAKEIGMDNGRGAVPTDSRSDARRAWCLAYLVEIIRCTAAIDSYFGTQ
jgi:hypothetical protein